MPKGKTNSQTIATAKYQEKAGYRAKSFKLKKELIEEFVNTCNRTGTSQAAWLSQKMREFIEENK